MNVYTEVRERDFNRCVLCKRGYGQTESHHITYRSRGGPDEAWNLISLCNRCHRTVHELNVPEWYLHAKVAGGGLRPVCMACDHREGTWCPIEEQDVDDDYRCGHWRLLRVIEELHEACR